MQCQNDNQQANNQQATNQQANQQTSKEQQMSDQDRITDILSTEKSLTNGYNTGVNEASTDELYQLQLHLLTEIHNAQRQTFNLMHAKGWYKLDQAPSDQINQKAQQFATKKAQLPYSN